MKQKRSNAVFKTPFSKAYWKEAWNELSSTRSIVMASILAAMAIILEVLGKMFYLELFGRQVLFSFIPLVISGFLFGPVVAIFVGAITDVLGFFLFTQGYAFFPGYVLSAILGCVIYSLFLYRTRVSLLRIFLAKFMVNFFINALLGSYWMSLLGFTSKTFWVLFTAGIIKNLILLPFEVAILYFVLKKLLPISIAQGYVSEDVDEDIKLI